MNNLAQLPIDSFLDRLASDAPTPGGGGVAALCGALATSLGNMVASFTTGRERYAQYQSTIDQITAELTYLQGLLTHAIDEDAQAFTAVMEAYALPKSTDIEKQTRTEAIQTALKSATQVPYQVMVNCRKGLATCELAIGKCNTHVITDLGAAAILFEAAAQASLLNVLVNTNMLHDTCYADEYRDQAHALLTHCQNISQTIQTHVLHQIST